MESNAANSLQPRKDTDDIAALPSGRTGLKRFIAAAVAHQLRRPGPEVDLQSDRVRTIFSKCLCGADLPDTARLPEAVDDLLAIMKAIIDTAGRRGESDHVALAGRVDRAVFGYLEW